MKNTISIFMAAILALFTNSCTANPEQPDYSKTVPPLVSHVNDYAQLFERETVDSLQAQLYTYEAQTSTQIVILTVEDIGDQSIEEYSMKVAENWRIGQQGKDNGVLITIAKKQKKVRIETGYGVEGA